MTPEDVIRGIEIGDGVRLIDTAYMYKNEAEVGQAIRESMEELGIQRSARGYFCYHKVISR